ncbi:MAG: helicase-exonuclease AddAB subunit AddA [Lachnospiraceae bacterium]|nr:helicase-exonuclease AddAB subunit AddA [Lachnospiraceae bacterium]
MALTFTPEQQKVIDLRNRNILVCAAAGSGKTAVLVERIIEIVTDEEHPVDIDRLLVVTFTNAAAAEMRERIGKALSARLCQTPDNVHLQRQVSLLHNAQITTIDSFCLFVIRNNFNDIGLDPGFRIADEGELRLLKQDTLTELLEQQYQEKNKSFLSCVEYFTGGSNDRLLEEYISKLYEFSMSYPWPEDWISQCMRGYKITSVSELEETDWCHYIIRYIRTLVAESIADLDIALQLTERPDGPYMYGETLEKEKEMLSKLTQIETFAGFYEAFTTVSFGRLPSKKDDSVNPLLREKVQLLRKNLKKRLDDIREAYLVLSPEKVVERMEAAAPNVEELLLLVLAYKELLDQRKRRDNMIDFHDMEHFALDILLSRQEDGSVLPSTAAREYRAHFKEILIDEYQDSNLVQELLLKSISGEEDENYNRFMVGDVKQSIYKFRLARPELFIEKYIGYTKEASNRQRIDLHRNFRSRPQVIDSVNSVFSRMMRPELGGVDYDEEAALYQGAVFPKSETGTEDSAADPYRTEYLVIGKDEESRLTTRGQEAAAIAHKIRELYASLKVTDKETGKLRPVRYSDIVILLRTTAGWAEEFKAVLEQEGIPAYVSSRTGYFQTVEIKVLMQLLRVIDNPLQDIPLYGTMKSFFGGFEEEEIAKIRAEDKQAPLYELLINYDGEEKEKVQEFLKWLSGYRRKTAYTPIHKLIQDILTETGYLDYVTARPGGSQRRANVEMLLTRAAAFENTSYYGLFHFLRYMEQLEKYEVDYGEADILDENADVVRIMSIHKSKGLEFPVCFVAGLSKRFNMQDTTGRMIADADMGIGVDYVDEELRLQSKTLKKRAVALKMKLDTLGEEMRVLYVAMTRAREKLILTGMTADVDQFEAELSKQKEFGSFDRSGKIPFSVLAGASCYLDFLFPCLDEVTLIRPKELFLADVQGAVVEIDRKQKLLAGKDGENKQIMTELSGRFEKIYPYQYLSDLFVKTTVSELKKKAIHDLSFRSMEDLNLGDGAKGNDTEQAFTAQWFEEPEIVPYIPSFISSTEEMSGTDRGSAYHKVMELLDFAKLGECREPDVDKQLNEQLEQFVEEGRLTVQWRESIDNRKIRTFLKSSLAKRMGRAAQLGRLRREQPFVLGLPASRLGGQFPESEQVLIQGIIDVFFEEDGRIIVADYKTDRVKAPEELITRYQVQLDYYAQALTRLTGKEVTEKIIYSFALGREIVLY